jgi:uncharacterized protein (DUF1501 family)
MCKYHKSNSRRGISPGDGSAHRQDHAGWSRRQFLTGLGLAMAGTTLSVSGTPVRAFSRSSLLAKLAGSASDRVLVLIQLSGGNDGLNTIIPISNDIYYNQRPTLAIPAGEAIALSTNVGMHPSLSPLEPFFGDGKMAVVQGVGYPSPDLSHFRSTDVWITGNNVDEIGSTGWSGRYLGQSVPDFVDNPPDNPLAVQIGSGSPALFQGPDAGMGMSLLSVDLFDRIADSGVIYDTANVSPDTQGNEISFVRSVANDSFQYAGAVQTAAANGTNDVEYPANSSLASHLAIVASLIKGGLGAKIYHVTLGGFDTHANQLGIHANLMNRLSSSISAFMSDIEASGLQDEVLAMTFSEFGRRVQQNGSGGCDHGTAAPMFLFGAGLNGGVYGEQPSLDVLDNASNMIYQTDFRSIYSTVLQHWFGLSTSESNLVLGENFDTLGLISNPIGTAISGQSIPVSFSLERNYPNPFNTSTMISFLLNTSIQIRLEVFDMTGRSVSVLMDRRLPAGQHTVPFNAGTLASGTYLYQIRSGRQIVSRQMTLIR